ncbi:F-box associated interaction domain [Arabidopsis thaliana x Arabidopsis arenosa]|uniref:F-box associated interaction domain n=1 Tax=Arabidopsis thaliana x Arabidopsis arenosa TaxID=1240361 RepID=A0A8T1Y3T6_9BRAS|nr:F-box associated interaction domain [Arabidopsis thaliana x Arabidopsis arenosa]
MAECPTDLINELFLRLAATTLVRCRAVSKPCFSLIDSPEFISFHLRRRLETGQHLMILLRGPRLLRTVELDSPENVSDIPHPLQAGGFTEVFGSFNGVIGLCNSPVDIAIFNPSTRKIHRLPIEPLDFPERHITREYVFYGLGYDSVSDDFKVVRMVQSKPKGGKKNFGCIEIKVFSLKKNSWKRVCLMFEVQILFIHYYYHFLPRRGYGVLANNHLHWILPRRQGIIAFNAIIRFDLASDDLGVLSFPRALYTEDDMDIGVLDGCVCLMCYDEFSHVDVWVLKEYEDWKSWTKMFRVPKPESVESVDFMRPMVYSKDRSKILLEINNAANLMWFDLESKSLTTVGIECDSSFTADILVSSLVLGCKGDPTEAQRRKDQMVQKSNKRDGFLAKGFKLKL